MTSDNGFSYQIAPRSNTVARDEFSNDSDISTTIQVTSNIPRPVTVRDRNSLTHVLPAKYTGGPMRKDIIVTMMYRVSNNVVKSDFDIHCISGIPELECVREAFANKEHHSSLPRHYTVKVSFTFTEEYLWNNGGTIYVKGADLLISLLPEHEAPRHPYDAKASDHQIADALKEDYNGVCVRGMRLIDSQDQLGIMYTNIQGEIYKVVPDASIDDLSATSLGITGDKDGLYLLGDMPIKRSYQRRGTNKGYRNDYVPISELIKNPSKYNLYASPREARSQGNKQLESAQNAVDVQLEKVEGLNEEITELKRQIETLKRQNKHQANDNMWKGFMDIPKILAAVVTFVKTLR